MYNFFDKNLNLNIIIAGIIKLFIGVGIARFAYTTLLPNMLENQVLTLTFSGVLASINYVGYLSGAIFSIFIKSFQTKVILFRLGVIFCILTTFILGITTNEIVWLLSRLIAGFASAMLLVVGAAIVMVKLNYEDKTKAMGLYFMGIGIALSSSDLISRFILENFNWETSWIVLSLCGVVVAFYPMYILSFDKDVKNKNVKHPFDSSLFTPFVILLIFAYFTEGVGFVIQGTFLPTIIKSIDGMEEYASLSWLLVGLAGIPSSIIWMRLAYKFGSVNMIIITMSLQVVGILIPTLFTNVIASILSGILYGVTFIGLVALFINFGGKIAYKNPVVLMGALTTAYGIGQVFAPLYAVSLTNKFGTFDYTLYLTAFIVFIGIIALLFAKKLKSYVF